MRHRKPSRPIKPQRTSSASAKAKVRPSMDQTILNLINYAERKGMLKISTNRFMGANAHVVHYKPDDLLRANDAASFLQVSSKTLANWRVSGTGPSYVKSGGSVTYRFADLQAYVHAQTRRSTSDTGVRS